MCIPQGGAGRLLLSAKAPTCFSWCSTPPNHTHTGRLPQYRCSRVSAPHFGCAWSHTAHDTMCGPQGHIDWRTKPMRYWFCEPFQRDCAHREILTRELESVGLRLNRRPPNIYFKKKKTGGASFNATVPLTQMDEKLCFRILQVGLPLQGR